MFPRARTTVVLALLSAMAAPAPTCLAAPSGARRPTSSGPSLGINLAGPADWSTELPFVDVFRLSRTWISQAPGTPWGKGPKLALDARGWVESLEPGCWAETPLCNIPGGHYPGGTYTVLYEGKGQLEFRGAATAVSATRGKISLRVDPSKGGFFLILKVTDPRDYVRNIRVLMPGAVGGSGEGEWNPSLLARWRGMACLRFMDLMKTNDSPVVTWDDRPKLDDATFSKKGVPPELLIDLANRLGADPWFCIPHGADDGYVVGLAKLVARSLDPKLKAYVEYSNEIWNGQFKQNAHASEQGRRLGLSDKPWEAAWHYTAHRSTEIFAIWEGAFGGTDRLVRVLASQAGNDFVSTKIAGFKDAARHADALAIAPYLSLNVGPKSTPPSSVVAGWSADRALDHLENVSLPEAIERIKKHKKVADAHGLRLIAYEGGQHMTVFGKDTEAVAKSFHKANGDPRIAKIYRAYLDAWAKEAGDLFCYFTSMEAYSNFGSFGLLQFLDDDPAQSPKYRAVADWSKALGQEIGSPRAASPKRRRR